MAHTTPYGNGSVKTIPFSPCVVPVIKSSGPGVSSKASLILIALSSALPIPVSSQASVANSRQ